MLKKERENLQVGDIVIGKDDELEYASKAKKEGFFYLTDVKTGRDLEASFNDGDMKNWFFAW